MSDRYSLDSDGDGEISVKGTDGEVSTVETDTSSSSSSSSDSDSSSSSSGDGFVFKDEDETVEEARERAQENPDGTVPGIDRGDDDDGGSTPTPQPEPQQPRDVEKRQDQVADKLRREQSKVTDELRKVNRRIQEADSIEQKEILRDRKEQLREVQQDVAQARSAARFGGAGVVRREGESIESARKRAAEETVDTFEKVVQGESDSEREQRARELREFTQREIQNKNQRRREPTEAEKQAQMSIEPKTMSEQPDMSRTPRGALDPSRQPQLQAGDTQTDGEDIFGNPISDTLEFFQVADPIGNLPSIPDTVRTVEDTVTDQFGSLVADIRELQSGKPAETTTERALQSFDEATRAEGVGGEQSGLDLLQGPLEGLADASQAPEAVEEFLSSGETDAFEQSRDFTPDETPVVTVGRLASEELSFEGVARGPSLLDEVLPGARAASPSDVTTSSPRAGSGVADEDTVVAARRIADEEPNLVDTDLRSFQGDQPAVSSVDPEDTIDIRLFDEESGRATPLSRQGPLGERIATQNPERFSEVRVTDTALEAESDVGTAESLVSRQTTGETPDTQPASTLDLLDRVVDNTPTDASLVDDDTVRLRNLETGRIQEAPLEEGVQLSQTQSFELLDEGLSPAERTRIREAVRGQPQDFVEDLRRSIGDEETLGLIDEATPGTGVNQQRGTTDISLDDVDSFFDLDRRGQVGLGRQQRPKPTPSDDLGGFADETSTTQRTLFPEAEAPSQPFDTPAASPFDEITGASFAASTTAFDQQQRGLGFGFDEALDQPVVELEQPGVGFETDLPALGEFEDEFTGVRQDQRQSQKQRQDQRQDEDQLLRPRQDQQTRFDLQPRGRDEGRGRPDEPNRPRNRPPAGAPPRFDDGIEYKNDGRAYNAVTNRRGEEVTLNDEPLTRKAALDVASEFADDTAARSVKLEPIPGEQPEVEGTGGFLERENKFRPSKSEQGAIVEETEFAIDSPGEKQDITLQGLQAQRQNDELGGGFGEPLL